MRSTLRQGCPHSAVPHAGRNPCASRPRCVPGFGRRVSVPPFWTERAARSKSEAPPAVPSRDSLPSGASRFGLGRAILLASAVSLITLIVLVSASLAVTAVRVTNDPAAGSVPLQATFSASQLGFRALNFGARFPGGVSDADGTNHRLTRTVEVVAFGDVPRFVSVARPMPPSEWEMQFVSRVIPTASHAGTTIAFPLPADAAGARLLVLDAFGRLVSRVEAGPLARGVHRLRWDAPPGFRTRVASSVHFYRLEADRQVTSGRLVLIR